MARVVLGICGGIAAFKGASIASQLVQQGHEVFPIVTQAATEFIGPATLTAICGRAPGLAGIDLRYPTGPHIEMVEGAKLFLIAPATARCLASCALGLADDLLSTAYLQAICPVVMAPAMSTPMWDKPAVQRNVERLVEDGVKMLGPAEGWLSCRRVGVGRMMEPEAIVTAVQPYLV